MSVSACMRVCLPPAFLGADPATVQQVARPQRRSPRRNEHDDGRQLDGAPLAAPLASAPPALGPSGADASVLLELFLVKQPTDFLNLFLRADSIYSIIFW
jgi:hypothetical protein